MPDIGEALKLVAWGAGCLMLLTAIAAFAMGAWLL